MDKLEKKEKKKKKKQWDSIRTNIAPWRKPHFGMLKCKIDLGITKLVLACALETMMADSLRPKLLLSLHYYKLKVKR